MNDKMKLAEWAVEQAKKAGADQAAVDISNRREIEVEYRDKKLEKLKESTQNSLSISIYVDNRYSSHSTNDLRKSELERFIQQAVESTPYLTADEYRYLPDPKYYPSRFEGDLKIRDLEYETLNSEQRVQLAREIEGAAMAVSDKIISSTAGFSDTLYQSVKVHSNGFAGESEGTYFSAGAEATVSDDGGGRPEDWYYATTRFYDELPSAAFLGRQAVQRALRKVGQSKIESGLYDMVVENRVGSRLLGMLQSPMSARSIQQKQSFLDGKLGEKIGSDQFTLIDDPFLPGGLGSRWYDGEGLAAQKRTFIEKGVLKDYFVDVYYGRKLGMEPTTSRPSNLRFELGNRSQKDIVAGLEKGILITGFIGGNSNPTTGDFSFGITGLLIENGEVVKPVNEMNISGNAQQFWQQLVEVGNDPNPYSSYRIPTFYFKDVDFSGI